MHRYPQNQSHVGSGGQTLTTNVSMTLCNWQICHQTHVLCSRTTFVPNEMRYQINTVPLYLEQGRGYCRGGGRAVGLQMKNKLGHNWDIHFWSLGCSWRHQGGLLAPRARTVLGQTIGKGHALVPWLLDAHILPTLGGGDDGGRHPITI